MSFLTFEGDRIRYERSGAGEPLLLVQGLGAPGAMWEAVLPAFAGFDCIWYDNPGTGGSDAPDDPASYTVERMARIARAVMDAAAWPRAHVWGGSMGSMVALQLALDAPERVRSLVLAPASASAHPVDGDHRAAAEEYTAAAAASSADPLAAARRMIPFWYGEGFLAANPGIDELVAAMFSEHPVTRLPELSGPHSLDRWDVTDRLGEIEAPTLICHGTLDRLLPVRRAHEVFAAIARSELRLYHAAHSFTVIDRDRILGDVATWLRAH